MKINPFSSSNPMSWKDAAKVSLVLTLTCIFTTFLLPYTFIGIKQDFGEFLFELLRFSGSVFFTNLVSLAGLARTEKKDENAE